MAEAEVVLERSGSIARVTLNRPERRNALGVRTLPALNVALDAIQDDPGVAVVILTGRGPVFCGGGDLEEIMSPGPTDREWEFGFIRGYNRVVRRLRELDPPVVAAVNGPAAGGGAALAMACDIAIAAESARYDFVFERIGLSSADMGCTHLLPRIVGPVRASYLLLTGGSVSAREGLALGLFADVVPDAALGEAATRVAERIAAGPRRATVISKLALRRGESTELGTDLEYEAYLQSFAFGCDDHKSRLAGFLARRRSGAR